MLFDLFRKPSIKVRAGKMKPVVLVILDGWGIAPPSEGNAITLANPENFNRYMATYSHSQLLAAGESVGLPANEVGNTEVGHLNIGAGRVILQDLPRINKSIQDGTFFENKSFYHALFHSKKNGSKIHIMGLVSSGQVHSSIKHLYALLEFLKRNNAQNVYLHVFTDGRDAPPKEAITLIAKLQEYLVTNKIGRIATISGRYYSMDRDKRWDRTSKAYDAMVKGVGPHFALAVDAIKSAYAQNVTDEFIVPSVIDSNGLVSDNDSAIFFNYRIDRPRQLTMAFVVSDFSSANISWEFDPYAVKYNKKHANYDEQTITREPFQRGKILSNLFFVTMTQYQTNLAVSEVAYPPEVIVNGLTESLAIKGLSQMHMAESEKERFVTYYFDGLREARQKEEDVLIVPSPKVPTYDKKPEMSVFKLAEEFKKVLNLDKYRFIVMNIANPDMVAHTGKIPETIKAIQATDKALGEIVESTRICGGTVLVTADHGNAEELITYPASSYFFTSRQGVVNTDHSTNPVPFIIIPSGTQGVGKRLQDGKLADVAPTVLTLLGIEIPPIMTGRNLLI